jgi:hypothetical protein
VGWTIRGSSPEVLQQQESEFDFIGDHTRILPYRLPVVDFMETIAYL